MKKILILFVLLLACRSSYSQDIYSRSGLYSGLEIIYSAKYYYEADSETPPVLYTGQDENTYVTGTAVYNPLDLTVSATWDSTSAYTITLTGLPERIDYSSSNLFTYISSNPRYAYIYYPVTVKSGTSIKCAVISGSDGSTEDIFRIIIAIKK
jgi:hypothetical protein